MLFRSDIALAFETVRDEALAAGKPFSHHVAHLLVHGVLHLRGFDHIKASDAKAMEDLERAALRRLGIDDPYEAAPLPRTPRATRRVR